MDGFGGVLHPAILGAPLRLVSGFPSRRGQRQRVLITHHATSHRITVGNPHCICIETICFHNVSGTLELLLQGPGMAIAEPKKNN